MWCRLTALPRCQLNLFAPQRQQQCLQPNSVVLARVRGRDIAALTQVLKCFLDGNFKTVLIANMCVLYWAGQGCSGRGHGMHCPALARSCSCPDRSPQPTLSPRLPPPLLGLIRLRSARTYQGLGQETRSASMRMRSRPQRAAWLAWERCAW